MLLLTFIYAAICDPGRINVNLLRMVATAEFIVSGLALRALHSLFSWFIPGRFTVSRYRAEIVFRTNSCLYCGIGKAVKRVLNSRDPAAAGSPLLLVHLLDTVRAGVIGTLGYVRFAAGSHTGTGIGRGKLFGHGRVDLVWLVVAKLICRHQNFVGFAIIPLVPVMTVVDNAVNVLANFSSPFLNYNPTIFFTS